MALLKQNLIGSLCGFLSISGFSWHYESVIEITLMQEMMFQHDAGME